MVLKRLTKICQDNSITLADLARIANVESPSIFELYDSGELRMDDDTVNRICEWSNCDWLWLEYGYEPEVIQAIDEYERMEIRFRC